MSLGDPDGIETPGSPPTEVEIDPGPVPAHAPVHPAEGVPGQLPVVVTVDMGRDGARTTGRERRTEILENPSLTRGTNLLKMTRTKTLSLCDLILFH